MTYINTDVITAVCVSDLFSVSGLLVALMYFEDIFSLRDVERFAEVSDCLSSGFSPHVLTERAGCLHFFLSVKCLVL